MHPSEPGKLLLLVLLQVTQPSKVLGLGPGQVPQQQLASAAAQLHMQQRQQGKPQELKVVARAEGVSACSPAETST